ncbi:MAG: hypothetical protein EOP86_23995 [Verrucomicrobiaceae bacterium]|nr:MAG: hypothetical protein EOP86_23995 [Verrucomicrobiaceae bacterium]
MRLTPQSWSWWPTAWTGHGTGGFLPACAVVDTAKEHDNKRARQVCAGLQRADRKLKGWTLRRVEAWVEVDGKELVMVLITNNVEWSAGSVCDLHKARWEIEVFFKQVKQTLRLSGFLGCSANAIRWQVWTALLVYVLLRFAAHLSQWGHSFTRLFAVVRATL